MDSETKSSNVAAATSRTSSLGARFSKSRSPADVQVHEERPVLGLRERRVLVPDETAERAAA